LSVASDDPDSPVLELALTGVGLDPPAAVSTPPRFDVTMAPDEQRTETLTASNPGGSSLEFSILVVRPGEPSAGPSSPEPTFQSLRSSPTTLTCVAADPAAGIVYAQAIEGTAFYRYRVASNTWEQLASSPINSGGGGAAALLNGRIYTITNGSPVLGVYTVAT